MRFAKSSTRRTRLKSTATPSTRWLRQADKPTVQRFFARLATDEAQHKAYLKNIMLSYEELGAGSFFIDPKKPDLGEFSSQVFTDDFRREAQGADFELGVLSTGICLSPTPWRSFWPWRTTRRTRESAASLPSSPTGRISTCGLCRGCTRV